MIIKMYLTAMMLNVHQPGAVWVSIISGASSGVIPGHISSRSQVRGFLTLVDQCVAAGAVPVLLHTSQVDGFCGHCGVCTTVV